MNTVTIVLLGVILLLCLLFFFKRKVVAMMHWALQILFALFLVLAITGLLLPGIYHQAADWSLERMGTLGSIQEVDNTLDPIINAPANIIGGIEDIFGGGGEREKVDGFLENEFYPGLVSSVGFIFRIIAIVLGFGGMIVAVYLGYTTASMAEVNKLRKEMRELREKVNSLTSTHAIN